ncbi:MAG: hypothetical protein IJ131_06720 [Eggerthellaceae bacterium]|nr:hypothetical protein [Eggerthellaceae bacterium]
MDDKTLSALFAHDFSEGTEHFRDALLARCLDVLDSEDDGFEIDDADLDMLAAAGDAALFGSSNERNDNPLSSGVG